VESDQRVAGRCGECGVEGEEADWSSQSCGKKIAVEDVGRGVRGLIGRVKSCGQQVAVVVVGEGGYTYMLLVYVRVDRIALR
jgi:hypothetical protein